MGSLAAGSLAADSPAATELAVDSPAADRPVVDSPVAAGLAADTLAAAGRFAADSLNPAWMDGAAARGVEQHPVDLDPSLAQLPRVGPIWPRKSRNT